MACQQGVLLGGFLVIVGRVACLCQQGVLWGVHVSCGWGDEGKGRVPED